MAKRSSRLTAAVFVVGLQLVPWLSPGAAVGQQAPAATAAAQVTTNPAPVRAHSVPQMARNPKTGELVIGEVDVRGDRRCRVHISADAGRSWFVGGDPMTAPFTDCSIGAEWGTYLNLFFDDDGTLYVPFAANDPKLFERSAAAGGDRRQMVPRHIFLARSTDSGRTFTNTTAYMAPAGDPARGYAYAVMGAIDPSAPQRVYITWAQGEFLSLTNKTHAVVAASEDGGRTFAAPIDITDEKGSEGAWLTVGQDGTLHAAFFSLGWDGKRTLFQLEPEDPPLPMIHARSSDRGRTWTREVIEPGYQQYERPPVIIADPDSRHLYVAWFGSPKPENLAPHFDDSDRADIFVMASADGGRTWSERTKVNDDRGPDTNQVHPALAIAPNGRLDVAWYDYRSSAAEGGNPLEDRGTTDVFYASSTDRGRTFGANVKVNDRSIDRSIGVFANRVTSVGPAGIASTNDEVFFAWQDSRNGDVRNQAEDVYAASLRLKGARLASSSGDSFNWGRLLAGVALGMGLAMVFAWALTRRQLQNP